MWDPPATEGGRLYSGGADQILPITFPFQLDAGAWHLPSFSGRTSGRYLLRIAVIPCGSFVTYGGQWRSPFGSLLRLSIRARTPSPSLQWPTP